MLGRSGKVSLCPPFVPCHWVDRCEELGLSIIPKVLLLEAVAELHTPQLMDNFFLEERLAPLDG